jgi:hypothetical protein
MAARSVPLFSEPPENGVSATSTELAQNWTSRAVDGDAIAHRSMTLPAFILFYGPELDGLGKRLRAFFASAADGPFGRIIK